MSTENRWIVVRRIYNPLQGDFWEDYNELDVVEGGSVEVFYGNGSCVLNQDAFFLGKSEGKALGETQLCFGKEKV